MTLERNVLPHLLSAIGEPPHENSQTMVAPKGTAIGHPTEVCVCDPA